MRRKRFTLGAAASTVLGVGVTSQKSRDRQRFRRRFRRPRIRTATPAPTASARLDQDDASTVSRAVAARAALEQAKRNAIAWASPPHPQRQIAQAPLGWE